MTEETFKIVFEQPSAIEEFFKRREEEKAKRQTFPVQTFKPLSYWPPDKPVTFGPLKRAIYELLDKPEPRGDLNKYEIREVKIDPNAVQTISDMREEKTLNLWLGTLRLSGEAYERKKEVVISDPKNGYNLIDNLKEAGVTLTQVYGWHVNPDQVKGYNTYTMTSPRFIIFKKKVPMSFMEFKDGSGRQIPENPRSETEFMAKINPTRPVTVKQSSTCEY